jgi:ABC-2 type transport system permease protein
VSAEAMMSSNRVWAAYLREMRLEFLKSLRTPAFSVPTLFFPVMFYVLFGVFLGAMRGQAGQAAHTFATFGVFGAMGPGLFGFGVALAIEREQGLLTLKQALPQPPGAYLLARAFMAMVFVFVIAVLLTIMAITLGKVPLTAGQIVQLLLIDTLGALPFCAIGMYLGALVSGQASPAIINCVFLPMAFLSGLFVPLQFMPAVLQQLAPVWPAYHLAQMALETVGQPSSGSFATHVGVLAAVTGVFFLLAVRRMHGSGFRLLGAQPGRVLAVSVGIAAVVMALAFSGVFGGKPAKTEDSTAATDAPSTATDTPASQAPSTPTGVPAPEATQIAGFDAGSTAAAFGIGFHAGGDEERGGNSKATQRLVTGGADGSGGALEISGEVGNAIPYGFAGTVFFPEGPPMQGLMDFTKRKALRFMARGDGGRYSVLVMHGPSASGMPLMYSFRAGPEWKEVRLDFAEFGNVDWQRVRLVAIGNLGVVGPFTFQIDDVRLE